MTLFSRAITPLALERLKSFPVLYINGPRQAGKTTLVRELLNRSLKADYVTFDDILERTAAQRNPQDYIKQVGHPLIIDEVQFVPELFRVLKMEVDTLRQQKLRGKGKATGQYLLTGSANLMAMPALADAMVGRMATLTLYPFSAAERENGKGDFIERVFAADFTGVKSNRLLLAKTIRAASFPELQNLKPADSKAWFENYIRKITLEDPRQLYNLEKAEYMPMLLQALAGRAGSLINEADLSRDVGLTANTVRTYRQLLQASFIHLALRPWHRNTGKRLVKAAKGYFYDTQLLLYLLQAEFDELPLPKAGHVLENFVASELLKLINNSGTDANLLYFRTRDGKEVDFVIEKPNGKLIGIEVKNAEKIGDSDLAGMKLLQEAAGKDFVHGYVLCNTPRPLPFGDKITLLPFSVLWG